MSEVDELYERIRELNQEVLDFLHERAQLQAALDEARRVIEDLKHDKPNAWARASLWLMKYGEQK
jgi:uncharacterized coiled-coil DUF342 family protein